MKVFALFVIITFGIQSWALDFTQLPKASQALQAAADSIEISNDKITDIAVKEDGTNYLVDILTLRTAMGMTLSCMVHIKLDQSFNVMSVSSDTCQ